MTGTFEVFADEEMYIRFRLTAPDGTVLAFSGRFPDKRAAAAGIAAVRECAGMGLITDLCPKSPSGLEGPGAPADSARDFISVDDGGKFMYHRSEQDLIAALEFIDEIPCVIDRAGNSFSPRLHANGRLFLGPGQSQVELYWLRQAWLDAQNVHAEEHRLKRSYPDSMSQILSDLFESLARHRDKETDVDPRTPGTEGIPSPRNVTATDERRTSLDQAGHAGVRTSAVLHTSKARQAPQRLLFANNCRGQDLRRHPFRARYLARRRSPHQ